MSRRSIHHPSESSGDVVRLNERDNVLLAAKSLAVGMAVDSFHVTGTPIPPGHKVACQPIAAGDPVWKFGQPIGIATQAISPGEHVHSHNLADAHQVDADWRKSVATAVQPSASTPSHPKFWHGFVRDRNRVGTRNYVQILSRVNCSATVCHHVAARFPPERLAEFPHVDGIAIATHTTGCALQYGGLKQKMLGRVLRGYAGHANVGACLTIGLGCEQTTPEYLREHHQLVAINDSRSLPVRGLPESMNSDDIGTTMLTMQAEGGTRATIDRAEQHLETMLDAANQHTRTRVPASELRLALECGGSDGYSGWTANPLVGAIADRMVLQGGAAVLSETTELIGAEHLLIARARDEAVAQRLIDKIDWWKQHVAVYGGVIDNNPSIGNKAGGLTTITEKSLGAVSKSGSGVLEGVLDYAASVPASGLYVMDSPGFDPSSVTGKVAGGCNLVLFTTGRGSCFGGKPVPVIKIASNSMLFEAMRDDMDWNAGALLDGRSIDDVADELFDDMLDIASGRPTASERLGLGDHEFVPWTVGPVL